MLAGLLHPHVAEVDLTDVDAAVGPPGKAVEQVPPVQVEALEFGVAALKVKHIVVLGHAYCGGVKAFAEDAEPLSPGDSIGRWMHLLKPAAAQIQNNDVMTAGERQRALERISIRNSLTNLRTFPCVQVLEQRGKLNLHGAWFDISTGELWIMDVKTGDFHRPGM